MILTGETTAPMTEHDLPKPVIAACAIHTALGDLNDTWAGLMAGKCGLQTAMLPGVPNSYPVGRIPALGDEYGSAERLETLLDLGFKDFAHLPAKGSSCDVIIATTKGAVDELLHRPENPSGQPWQLDRMVAKRFPAAGKLQTVSAACASGTVAIIQGVLQIMAGTSECVLIVGLDLLSSFVLAGFDALKGLSPNPCKPFDNARDGLSLGEGIGILLLCSDRYAAENHLQRLARVEGWGVSCDATHITAPSRTGSGLIRVIRQATRNGEIPVGAINAHGTGTVYNDAMEITAFKTCWEKLPPFHSVKGGIGHCLGAAGVIESAIAIRSLAEERIPPSIGYQDGNVNPAAISGESSLAIASPTILACNSGFGGINAGILFSRS